MNVEKTFIGNLKEFIAKKEFLNIFLVNGIKLTDCVAFANKEVVLICSRRNGRTYINPTAIASFQVAKEFAQYDETLR